MGNTSEETLNQHQPAIRNKNSQYQTYQHCKDEIYQPNLNNPNILDCNNKERPPRILESFYSIKHGNVASLTDLNTLLQSLYDTPR